MIFGTWNVQGLKTKSEEVIKGLTQMKMDIAVLTETKKKGNGIEQMGEFIHIYSGVPKNTRASKGVSIVLNKRLKNKITNWETISERITTVNLTLRGHRTTIIGVYAPNEDATILEKDDFYEQLEEILITIGDQRETVILGDFNARTGKRANSKVVGRHGEDVLNDNGRRLIQVCAQYNLRILNGFYSHKDIHKYTWHQQTRGLKSIIDYIIIKQDSKCQVQDTRAYRGTECGSDHYLVKSRINIPFKTDEKSTNEPTSQGTKLEQVRYNLNGLHQYSIRTLYQKRLDEKLNEQYLALETNKAYEHVLESIHSAALEALGKQQTNTPRNTQLTWNDELENQKQKKQQAYNKWMNTKDENDRAIYRLEQREFKKIITQNKNETWERRCKEIDTYLGGTRSSEAWKFIKSVRTENANKININPVQLKEWQQHYSRELAENREKYITQSPTKYQVQGQQIQVTEKMVWKAVESMKNRKAAGPEGIPAELLKNGTEKLIKMLTHLLEKYVNGEIIPQIWKEAWITPIHKKGSRTCCHNYRCISVTSTFSRVYGKILRNIIEEEYGPCEIEEQSGFRAGRSCLDNIFALTQLNEKKSSTNREVHLLFVDLTKAYDTVPIKTLWQVLEVSPINSTAITAIKQLYDQSYSKIKLANSFSNSFLVTKGLRQGCCLSPTLFRIYLNETLKRWRRACGGMGIQLTDNTTLYTLHFADDQVVIAQDKEDLEFMTRRLFEEYENWGLTVNYKKTKYLCIGGEEDNLTLNSGEVIETCEEYTYLGTKIEKNGRTEREIEDRISKGKAVIGHLNSVLWSKNVSLEKKRYIYDSIFKSIVLYGCETWQLTRRLEQRLLALEMDYFRRSARISRTDRVRNEQIREMMKLETTIIEEIQHKQLTWYGHVERMASHRIPKLVHRWNPMEKRRRGRPKASWMGGIQRAMSERNLRPGDWEDRRGWKLGTGRRRTL